MKKHHATGIGGLAIGGTGGLVGALYVINASITQIAAACGEVFSLIPTT